MIKIGSALAIAAAFGAFAASSVPSLARDAPAVELQKTIAGRVAGKPVDCISLQSITSSRVIDKTALVFETTGNTVYVNTPPAGASSLDSNNIMVIDTRTPQLCSVDTIRFRDPASRMDAGFVGLGQFIPYTKPKPQ